RGARSGQGVDLHLADGDGGAGDGQGGGRLVGDIDGDGVGALFAVGVCWCVDAEVVAAGVDDVARRGGAVTPVNQRGVVGVGGAARVARVRLGAGRVGEGRQAGDRRGGAALGDRLRGARSGQGADLHLADGAVDRGAFIGR